MKEEKTDNISPIRASYTSKLGQIMTSLGFEYNHVTNEWIEPSFPTPYIGRCNLEEVNDVGNGCGTLSRGQLNDYYIIQKKRGKNSSIKSFRISKRRETAKTFKQTIPSSVRKQLLFPGVCCPISGSNNTLEVDHKDGRKPTTCVKVEDYQILSKAANDSKRQACKDCKKTGLRYDAKKMYYPISVTKGTLKYEGTCEGCFWHDIKDFRSHLVFVEK